MPEQRFRLVARFNEFPHGHIADHESVVTQFDHETKESIGNRRAIGSPRGDGRLAALSPCNEDRRDP